MSDQSSQPPSSQSEYVSNATAAALQIGLIFLLAWWCISILLPFVGVVAWAAIISIALYPLHQKLASMLGGKEKLAATLIVVIGIALLVLPTWSLTESSVVAVKSMTEQIDAGTLKVPPPDPSVAEWPLIGERVHSIWAGAAANLEATINQFQPQLKAFTQWLVGAVSGTLFGVLGFVISLLIAGAFLVSADPAYRAFTAIGVRLAGDLGSKFTDMSVATVRSVAKGVLGVAFIQSLLAAIGLIVMDVPAAGIWAGLILLLGIMQLPPLLVLGPIVVWVFSTAETMPAVIFLVYSLLVSFSDAVLKPLLLGRGVEVPTLVILLGAIGGMMSSGIIGLFTGAIILSLGYEMFMFWLKYGSGEKASEE